MLSYEIDGQGPPLLLIHGFGISYPIWRELRPRLREHFTLIMVELPGIGGSPPPSYGCTYTGAAVQGIEELRLSLGVERWSILSYSSGTRIAEAYVKGHGGRVERAVFLCPVRVGPATAAGLRAAIRLDRLTPWPGTWALSGGRLRFLVRLLGFNMQDDPLCDEWFDILRSRPMDILKETFRAMPRGGATEFCLPADVPALFVWGRNDLLTVPPRRPSTRDLVVRGAHSAPQSSAPEIAAGILPFLREAAVPAEQRPPLPAAELKPARLT